MLGTSRTGSVAPVGGVTSGVLGVGTTGALGGGASPLPAVWLSVVTADAAPAASLPAFSTAATAPEVSTFGVSPDAAPDEASGDAVSAAPGVGVSSVFATGGIDKLGTALSVDTAADPLSAVTA